MSLQTEIGKNDARSYDEVVGLLSSSRDLERALAMFTSSGWDRADLSLLAQHNILLPEHLRSDTSAIADDPAAERAPPTSHSDVRQGRILATGVIGVVVAFAASAIIVVNGGSILLAAIGAIVAAGVVVGVVEVFGSRVAETRRKFLREQVDHKGIVLWVTIKKPGDEERAREIFARLGARDVHVREHRSNTTFQ